MKSLKHYIFLFLIVALAITACFGSWQLISRSIEQRTMKQYLHQISNDLDYDLRHLESLILQDSLDLETIVGVLSKSASFQDDNVGADAYRLLKRPNFKPQIVTFEMIKAEGKLSIVSNFGTKSAMSFLYLQAYEHVRESDQNILAFIQLVLSPEVFRSVRVSSDNVASALLSNPSFINSLVLYRHMLEDDMEKRKLAYNYALLTQQNINQLLNK
jgi:hypothetical protein